MRIDMNAYDPILEEVYAIRRKISEKYGHSIDRMFDALLAKRKEEEATGIVHHFADLPIVRTTPAPTIA